MQPRSPTYMSPTAYARDTCVRLLLLPTCPYLLSPPPVIWKLFALFAFRHDIHIKGKKRASPAAAQGRQQRAAARRQQQAATVQQQHHARLSGSSKVLTTAYRALLMMMRAHARAGSPSLRTHAVRCVPASQPSSRRP